MKGARQRIDELERNVGTDGGVGTLSYSIVVPEQEHSSIAEPRCLSLILSSITLRNDGSDDFRDHSEALDLEPY